MEIGLKSNLLKDNLSGTLVIKAQKSEEIIAKDIERNWKRSLFPKILKIKLKRLEQIDKNCKSIELLEIKGSKDESDKKEKNKTLQIVEISDDESIREVEASSTSKLQKCSICKFSVKNIDRHNMSFHKSTNFIFCQYCPKVFLKIEGLLIHEKNYHTQQNTDTNNTKFGTDTENNKVQVIELSDDELAENCLNIEQINKHKKCSICKISIKNMEAHNKKIHKNTKLIFCEVCTEAFMNIQSLLQHEKIKHPLIKTCLECKDTAETQHLKQLRILLKPLYPCEICSKIFNHHRLLELHFMIHQRMCHTCGKLCTLKSFKSYDVYVNRDPCHLCGKYYKTERKLIIHRCHQADCRRKTENNKGIITLLCFQCGKSCHGEIELKDHDCLEADYLELIENVAEIDLIGPEPYNKQENGTKDCYKVDKENELIELVDLEKTIVETVILKDNENDNNLNKISEKEKYVLKKGFENNQLKKTDYLNVELMEVDKNFPEPYNNQKNGTKDCYKENYKDPTESDVISSSSLCFTCGRVYDQADQLKNHDCSEENTNMKDKSSEESSCQNKNTKNSKQEPSSNVPCLRCGKVFKENKLNHNCQVDKENELIELVDIEKNIVETVILKDNENDYNLNKISEKEKFVLKKGFENNKFKKTDYLNVELMEVDDNLIAFVADEENGVVDIDFYHEVDLPQKICTNKRGKKKFKNKEMSANEAYSVVMFNDNGELNSSCNPSSFQNSINKKNKTGI